MWNWLLGWLADVVHLAIRAWWVAEPYEEGRWIWNWLRLIFCIILIAAAILWFCAFR